MITHINKIGNKYRVSFSYLDVKITVKGKFTLNEAKIEKRKIDSLFKRWRMVFSEPIKRKWEKGDGWDAWRKAKELNNEGGIQYWEGYFRAWDDYTRMIKERNKIFKTI